MDAATAWIVLLLDAGIAAAGLGLLSLVKPLRRLGIASRRRGAIVAASGVALACAAAALPAPRAKAARPARLGGGPVTRLDELLPVYQFHERHETRVRATPERVMAAVKAVTAEEITLFRTLTWLRRPRLPWRPTAASILAPAPGRPILAVATASGFVPLAEEPDRELVVGTFVLCTRRPAPATPAEWRALEEAGNAKAALNFLVEPLPGGGCRLSTETRVFATDAASCRRFAAYWRLILPGSALIRVEWLRAIRRRAE